MLVLLYSSKLGRSRGYCQDQWSISGHYICEAVHIDTLGRPLIPTGWQETSWKESNYNVISTLKLVDVCNAFGCALQAASASPNTIADRWSDGRIDPL